MFFCATYDRLKRPLLLIADLERLLAIADKQPIQPVIAGKAHPHDSEGKDAIRRIHELARDLPDRFKCVFLPNYEMQLAAHLVARVDLWLNTPLPPLEASGTSRAQRRLELQRAGRMVDRGLRRGGHRLVDRR